MEALSSLPSPESSQSILVTCLAPGRCTPGAGRALVALVLGRLLAGIAGYADYLVAGRGRVLPPLESNPP